MILKINQTNLTENNINNINNNDSRINKQSIEDLNTNKKIFKNKV